MSSDEKIEIKFVVNKPVYAGGPIVEFAIVVCKPNGDIVVPAWS